MLTLPTNSTTFEPERSFGLLLIIILSAIRIRNFDLVTQVIILGHCSVIFVVSVILFRTAISINCRFVITIGRVEPASIRKLAFGLAAVLWRQIQGCQMVMDVVSRPSGKLSTFVFLSF